MARISDLRGFVEKKLNPETLEKDYFRVSTGNGDFDWIKYNEAYWQITGKSDKIYTLTLDNNKVQELNKYLVPAFSELEDNKILRVKKQEDGSFDLVWDDEQSLEEYVKKEEGKGLSTNDFTNDYKEKLDKAVISVHLGESGEELNKSGDVSIPFASLETDGVITKNDYAKIYEESVGIKVIGNPGFVAKTAEFEDTDDGFKITFSNGEEKEKELTKVFEVKDNTDEKVKVSSTDSAGYLGDKIKAKENSAITIVPNTDGSALEIDVELPEPEESFELDESLAYTEKTIEVDGEEQKVKYLGVKTFTTSEDLSTQKATDGSISLDFNGIVGKDYISAELSEVEDESGNKSKKWVIGQAEKDEVFFSGTLDSVIEDNGDQQKVMKFVNDTAISSNVYVMSDGTILCYILESIVPGKEPGAVDKLIFNLNEKVANNTFEDAKWHYNGIIVQQGQIVGDLPESPDDLASTYKQVGGWDVSWGSIDNHVWDAGNYYSGEVGHSEITWGQTIQNGVTWSCYRIIYTGEEIQNSGSINARLSIIANKEGLTKVNASANVEEITKEVEEVAEAVETRLLTNMPFSSITGSFELQKANSSNRAQVSLFRPDMQFTISRQTEIKCNITQGNIGENEHARIVIAEVNLDNPTNIQVLAISESLGGFGESKNNGSVVVKIEKLYQDEPQYNLSTSNLYYIGIIHHIQNDIKFMGNNFDSQYGMNNVKPFISGMTENLNITDIDSVFTSFTSIAQAGSSTRIFFALRNEKEKG